MTTTKNVIERLLLIFSVLLILAGFLMAGFAFMTSSDFAIAKIQFFIWGVTGIFFGVVLYTVVRSKQSSYAVKIFLFGSVILLVIASIFIGKKCPDLKQELVLPKPLEKAKIIWNTPMVYIEDLPLEYGRSCPVYQSVGKEIWWGGASPRNKKLSAIPQNMEFTIVDYFRVKPFMESSDGFFGVPSKTYLVVKDQNNKNSLVWVGFLKYGSYYLDEKRFEDFELGLGY